MAQRVPQSGNPWDVFGSQQAIDVKTANSIGANVWLGLQESSAGLAIARKLPDMQAAADAPWYHRLARMSGQVIGDLPAGVAGAVGGAIAGAAVTGPGAPAGAAIGGAAGGFAAPMAIREALVEAYSNNHATSWEGVWNIALAGLKGGAKGAVIGGVTGGAGRFVAGAMPAAGALTKGAAVAGAELTAMTATSAAIEGHLPTAQDFMDNAILLVGMKAAVHTAKALRTTYAETGKHPQEVFGEAQADPKIKADLTAGKVPEAYKPISVEERVNAALQKDVRPEVLRDLIASDKGPIDLSKPVRGDPVRMEYIVGPDEYKGVLRDMTALYEPEIQGQRRGTVSNVETLAEMRKLLGAGELPPAKVGQAANAAEMSARLALLRSATHDAYAAIKEHAALAPEDVTPMAKLKVLAAIERMKAFQQEASGVLAEWGRAGQMVRELKRDSTVLDSANNLLKLVERKGDLQDIAKLMEPLQDPAQLNTFAKKYLEATTTEKVLEAWRAGLVSGPLTHQANMMGNLGRWVVEVPEKIISSTFYAVDRAAKGDPLSFAQWKARAFAPVNGWMLGGVDGLKVAAETLKNGASIYDKVDVSRGTISGTKGEVVRLPFRFLAAQDAMMRVPAERAQAYIMAVDRATKEGIHPDTVEGRQLVASYVAEPTLGLTEKAAQAATKAIEQAGAEAVFAQQLGRRMAMLQTAVAGHWTSFIVPFIRTPVNLLSWAVQHTPGLNFLSERWRSDFAAGGEARANAIARVVVGTGIAATAYSMAEQGSLTGAGMFDKEEGSVKRAAGWQPYSIKVGDKYYSYQRLEPISKIMGLAADLIELQTRSKDENDQQKIAYLSVAMFGNATISTTYLSGLNGIMQAMTDPERHAGNFMEQYASSVVPRIIGQPVAMADPYKREVDGIVEAIAAQLPYFREKLLPKRDVWGEKVLNERALGVTPITVTEVAKEKVRTEAMRLHFAIADVPKFIVEPGIGKERERRTKLTEEQRDIAKEVSGKKAMEILAPIVNGPDWESIPDFAQVAIYKKVIEGTAKQGRYAALPPDAAQRQIIRDLNIERIQEQSDKAKMRQKMQFDNEGNMTMEPSMTGILNQLSNGGSERRMRFDSRGELR